MHAKLAGFEEIQHTADWAVRVWAPDLPNLFAEAALSMNYLSGARLADSPRLERTFTAQAADNESLLVTFLTELIFYAEQENLAFDTFDVRLGKQLKVCMQGAPLAKLVKAIKAVTFHNIHIQHNQDSFEVVLVFDV